MAHEPTHLGTAEDENGVDRSLIRWFLSLSPTQRLQSLRSANSLVRSASDARRP